VAPAYHPTRAAVVSQGASPLDIIDEPFLYGGVFTGTLPLAYLPYLAAMTVFQHYGFAGP
jgi:hypothetical protein